MRGLAHHVYALTFRAMALMGLVFVAWMISNVPGAVLREHYVGLQLSVAVIAGVVSLALLWPYLTPTWIEDPASIRQVPSVVLAFLFLPLLFGFVGISAIVTSGVSDTMQNILGIAIAVLLIAAGAICLGLGTALCFWQEEVEETGLRDNVSVLVPLNDGQAQVRIKDTPEVDFRAAREGRISRVG